MNKIVVTGVALLALAGSTTVYAQHRHWQRDDGRGGHARMSPEDRLAMLDARIAAVKAGLKLTPEQEKSWPAIESAVRDFAKQRIERAQASANQVSPDQTQPQDLVARLRERADRLAATAAGLKRIADAADPLYKTLDDGQKRRLALLTRMGGGGGGFGAMRERGMGRDFNRDERGPGGGR